MQKFLRAVALPLPFNYVAILLGFAAITLGGPLGAALSDAYATGHTAIALGALNAILNFYLLVTRNLP